MGVGIVNERRRRRLDALSPAPVAQTLLLRVSLQKLSLLDVTIDGSALFRENYIYTHVRVLRAGGLKVRRSCCFEVRKRSECNTGEVLELLINSYIVDAQ